MTVIIGVNLSERSLLAGDTRLSYEFENEIYTQHDNMQKVENLGVFPEITIACAGNAKFAQYIITKLKENTSTLTTISELKDNYQKYFGQIAQDYFVEHGYDNAEVTLIVAGSDPNKRKEVNGSEIKKLADAYTGGSGLIYVNDSLKGVIKPGPIPNNENQSLEINDTELFAIEITKNKLNLVPTKWGQLLIYGPEGLVKDDIEDKDIAYFEFDSSTVDNGTGVGNDITLLTSFIESQARKYNLSSVGGSVLVYENNFDGSAIPLSGKVFSYDPKNADPTGPRFQQIKPDIISEIDASDPSKIYRHENGTRYKLKPISKYDSSNSEKMYL